MNELQPAPVSLRFIFKSLPFSTSSWQYTQDLELGFGKKIDDGQKSRIRN
jgi:hypothetical protein